MAEGGNRWGFDVAAAYAAMGRRGMEPLGGRFLKPQWDEDGNRVRTGSGKGRLEVYPFVLPKRDGGHDELARLLGHPKDMRRAREAVAHVWAVWEAALAVYGPEGAKISWSDARRALKVVHAFAVGLAVLAEGFGRMVVDEGRWVPEVEDGEPEPFPAWDAPEGTEWSLLRSLPADLALAGGFDLGGVPFTLKKALSAWSDGKDLTATLELAAKLPKTPKPGQADRLGLGEPVWDLVRHAVLRAPRPGSGEGRLAAAADRRAAETLDDVRTELLVDLVLGSLSALDGGLPSTPRATVSDLIPYKEADGKFAFAPAEIPLDETVSRFAFEVAEIPMDDTVSRDADSRLASAGSDLGHVMALARFVFGNLDRIRSEGWAAAYGRLLGLSSKAVRGEWTDVPGWAWKAGAGFDPDIVLSVADRVETAARGALDTIGKQAEEEGYLEHMDEIRESAGSLMGAVAASAPERMPSDPLAWSETDAEAVWQTLPAFVRTEISELAAERGPVPLDAAGMFRRLSDLRTHDERKWKGDMAREAVCRIVEALGRSGPLAGVPEKEFAKLEARVAEFRQGPGERTANLLAKNLHNAMKMAVKRLSPAEAAGVLALLTDRETAALELGTLPPPEAVKRLADDCMLAKPSPGAAVSRKASAPPANVWLLWGCAEVCSMFGVPIPEATAVEAPHRLLADKVKAAAGLDEDTGWRAEHGVCVKAALDGLGMPSSLSGIRWSP